MIYFSNFLNGMNPQVNVQYSSDHGMSWTDLVLSCYNDMSCSPHSGFSHSNIAAAHYHGTHDNWRRITIHLEGLPISGWVLLSIMVGHQKILPPLPQSCLSVLFLFLPPLPKTFSFSLFLMLLT